MDELKITFSFAYMVSPALAIIGYYSNKSLPVKKV